MVVKKEEEVPPGLLAWSCHCWVCWATSKSGVTPPKWVNRVPQIRSALPGENQAAVIHESLLALWSLPVLFFVVFYELLFGCLLGRSNRLAELQEQSLLLRLLKRPTTATHHNLIMSQLQVQHLWDVWRALPKMQVISALCFSKATFYFPLKNRLNETHASAHALNGLKVFPAPDLLTEEFGVNGPLRNAVAKKPWLATLMSFCSLASVSPMETLLFRPRWLVQRRVCSARSSALQCPWHSEVGSQCPLFSNHLPSWFLMSCPLHVPAACYVFAVWDWLRWGFSQQRAWACCWACTSCSQERSEPS